MAQTCLGGSGRFWPIVRPWFQAFFDEMIMGKLEADIAVPPNRSLRAASLKTFVQPIIAQCV